jgi:hypothetical protein
MSPRCGEILRGNVVQYDKGHTQNTLILSLFHEIINKSKIQGDQKANFFKIATYGKCINSTKRLKIFGAINRQ